MVRFFFVPVFINLNMLQILQSLEKLCHDYALTLLCIAVIDLTASPDNDKKKADISRA